jgi:alpha-amylase
MEKIRLLLRNYRLSDDISFRFSERGWYQWPLTAEKFAAWIGGTGQSEHVVNIFLDYETSGEYQSAETGIFQFLEYLPGEVLKQPGNDFRTATEAAKAYEPAAELDIPNAISWAEAANKRSFLLCPPNGLTTVLYTGNSTLIAHPMTLSLSL